MFNGLSDLSFFTKKDIDFSYNQIEVRVGKGGKDRLTMVIEFVYKHIAPTGAFRGIFSKN
jgi:hypothetical protein